MTRRYEKPDLAEMQMAVAVLLATAGRAPDYQNKDDYLWIWDLGPRNPHFIGETTDQLRLDYWWNQAGLQRRNCWTVFIGQPGNRNRRKAGPDLASVLAYLQRPDIRKAYDLDRPPAKKRRRS